MEGIIKRCLNAWVGAFVLIIALTLMGGPPAQAASPAWKLLAATGPTHVPPSEYERQTVRPPSSGTFHLTFDGDTTSEIPADGARTLFPEMVEEALNDLPSIKGAGGSVSVTAWTYPC